MPMDWTKVVAFAKNEAPFPRPGGIRVALAQVEAVLIETALDRFEGNQRQAAEWLGISRYALSRRIARVAKTLAPPTVATP